MLDSSFIKFIVLADIVKAWYLLKFHSEQKIFCFSFSFFRTWYADLVSDI